MSGFRQSGGSLEVTESGLGLPIYDYVANAPTSLTDVYTFYVGGSGGRAVAIVTIVYTDTTKATISSVTKSIPGEAPPLVTLHQAFVTLTNAQVLAIGDAPVQIADAPGANRMIVPVSAMMIKDQASATDYAGGGTLYLVYTEAFNDDGTGFTLDASSIISGGGLGGENVSSPFINNATGIINTGAENFVDQGLWVFGDANFTGGFATTTVTIVVAYGVLNIATGLFE